MQNITGLEVEMVHDVKEPEAVVGKVTVTPLQSYITSSFL